MKKITVHIADQQYVRLKALAEALGVKQAELLRQFLEDGFRRTEREMLSTPRRTEEAQRRITHGREDF